MASEKFLSKLEERRKIAAAAEEQERISAQQLGEFDAFIPENPYERSEEQVRLDEVIDRIDIWTAYKRWISGRNPKKSINMSEWGREEVHVSCPKPDHPDARPSAWINGTKGQWFCGGCQEGGDKFDFAAYALGFPVPGYKEGAKFHELREAMAVDLGYSFHKPPGASEAVLIAPDSSSPVGSAGEASGEFLPPEPTGVVNSEQNGQVGQSPQDAQGAARTEPSETSVTTIYTSDEDELADLEILWPTLDWRKIVPADSFLDVYMKATTSDDVSEEYHFWNGLLAVGFALGRDVTLYDRIPVYGNLNVCTLGHTGSGKSQAKYHLDSLLTKALPHDWKDPNSKGVERISTPGSAEVLIHSFQKPITDPANPKIVLYFAPVRGLVDFSELSSLASRSERQGNALKPTIMQFYDMERVISTRSMATAVKEAHDPFCSILTTTQPRSIKKLMTQADADSGFLNRWVFAAGPEKKRIAIGGVMIDIEPAVAPLQSIIAWAGFGMTLQWTPEGHKRFTEFYDTVIAPTKRNDESGLLTRTDLLMKKLCLLLSANKEQAEISLDTVNEAILMWQYIIDCYAIPGAQIGNSLQHEVREEILRHAERLTATGGKGVSLNDLNKRLKRKKYPADLVVKMLKYMVDLGELEIETARGPGRPTIRYKHVG